MISRKERILVEEWRLESLNQRWAEDLANVKDLLLQHMLHLQPHKCRRNDMLATIAASVSHCPRA